MTKKFNESFQTQLWDAIKSIENTTQAEIVVVMRARSSSYRHISLCWGLVFAWLCHSFTVFAPYYFEDWLVYWLPLMGFCVGFGLGLLPANIRLTVKHSELLKNVEIMARAIFQKGGIQHTQAKVGLLIYCSWLEKIVYLLPDTGVEAALPTEVWQTLRNDFQQIFASKHPPQALITQLQQCRSLFSVYLPIQPDDINELPNVLEIEL